MTSIASTVRSGRSSTVSGTEFKSRRGSDESEEEEEEEDEEDDDDDASTIKRSPRGGKMKKRGGRVSETRPTRSETGYSSDNRSTRRGDSKGTLTGNVAENDEEDEDAIKENFINTFHELGANKVGSIDAIQIACICEDISDQLEVIGSSMDVHQVDLRTRLSVEYDDSVLRPLFTVPATEDPLNKSIFKDKFILRQRYGSVTQRRIAQHAGNEPGSGFRDRHSYVMRGQGLHKFTQKGKIYSDKTHINIILDNVITELVQHHTFKTLQDAVDIENQNFREMREKFERKIATDKRIQDTKELLKKTRREKRISTKEGRKAMMAIEDNKQEILKRKELEYLYVHKTGELMKTRVKKMCTRYEREAKVLMDDQKAKMKLCDHAHFCMLDIIYKKYREAQRKLEYWMDKYELDKESLQNELDTMKANRQRDLERMTWLRAFITDYNQIVKDERRIKGIANERVRVSKLEIKKATKMQAWWRGEMVRKKLGPYMSPEDRAKRNRKK